MPGPALSPGVPRQAWILMILSLPRSICAPWQLPDELPEVRCEDCLPAHSESPSPEQTRSLVSALYGLANVYNVSESESDQRQPRTVLL